MRYEHFLRPVKSEAQPRQALAVEAEADIIPHPSCNGVEIEVLKRWHALRWTADSEGCSEAVEEKGTDASSFWRLCERLMRKGVVTWVFALPCSRILELLGFWEELEARRLYLSDRDYRDRHGRIENGVPTVRGNDHPHSGASKLPSVCTMPGLSVQTGDPHANPHPEQANPRARSVGYCVLEDPPLIVQCRRKGRAGSLRFVDLRNYGYSGSDSPQYPQEKCRWIASTAQAMVRTLRHHNLGGLQNTASSQALVAFKKRFLTHSVYVHCDQEALHLERESYYGGRTEAKRLGRANGRTFLLDIRSAYPYLGATMALPVRLVGVAESPAKSEVLSRISTLGAIALCHLSTEEPVYPLRRMGATIFPIGVFTTCLAGPELTHALSNNRVVDIYRIAYYELAPALQQYAQTIADLRHRADLSGDRSASEFLKRLGVSIYGKFAQSSAFWRDSTERCADHPYHTWVEIAPEGHLVRWRAMGWEVQREQKYHPGERPEKGSEGYERWARMVVSREAGESCPAIASYVTSAGRLLLWSCIQSAGSDNVLYYDTDSLFVNQEGLANLYHSGLVGRGEIGRLTIRSVSDDMVIHGVKHYEHNGQVTCSGMPRGEVVPSPDRESYYLRSWIGKALNSGEKPRSERVKRVYQRTGSYRQGHVDSKGRVTPWRIGS